MKTTRASNTPRSRGTTRKPSGLSRHELYELTVQKPRLVVELLRAIYDDGAKGETTARVLAEDFCGTAAISRAWAAGIAGGRAVAIDIDAGVLKAARSAGGVTTIRGDVRRVRLPARTPRADVLFVGNFSIGEIHDRRELVAYLRRSRARLAQGGVFVCDTYGGATAFATGAMERTHEGPAGQRIRYTWEQRHADALTGMVENAIHFRVFKGAEVVQEITDAFVYRWRLWSVPELRDAMAEAGFRHTAVYATLPGARDGEGRSYIQPIEGSEVDETFIVCVAGRR